MPLPQMKEHDRTLAQFWQTILDAYPIVREQAIHLEPLDIAIGQFAQTQYASDSSIVPLMAALLGHASREGQVCLSLGQLVRRLGLLQSQWPNVWPGPDRLDTATLQDTLARHPAVCPQSSLKDDEETIAFLCLEEDRLYLRRFWALENEVLTFVQKRHTTSGIACAEEHYPGASASQQKAIQKALACLGDPKGTAQNGFFVLTGGPGTGKTWTVVRILAALQRQRQRHLQPPWRVAMATPTGKAATRLQEAIQKDKAHLDRSIEESIPNEVATLHRLLGASQNSSSFRFHKDNPLDLDLLIIDEASMVDLRLMAKTMAALPAHAGLMLVGDKDQLASVEAGSVLADLCFADAPYMAVLKENHRARGTLLTLVQNLQQNPDIQTMRALCEPLFLPDIRNEAMLHAHLLKRYQPYFQTAKQQGLATVGLLFQAFNAFQVLCPHREGPYGTVSLNAAIEQSMIQKNHQAWYAGRAIMITRNHYGLGLFNGDIGLTMLVDGQPRVFFETTEGIKDFAPSRLPPHELAFAMTVHKSQGSEFDEVMLVLPEEDLPILTRELLYTAVTRAKEALSIIGDPKILEAGLDRHIDRTSGLRQKLQSLDGA